MSKITSLFSYSPKAVEVTQDRDEGHRASIIAVVALGAAALLTPEVPNFVIDTPNRMQRVEEFVQKYQGDQWFDPLTPNQILEQGSDVSPELPAQTYHFDNLKHIIS